MQKVIMVVIMVLVVLFLSGSRIAHPFDLNGIEIHGFASTGYMRSDHNNYLVPSEEGSFEFNEAGINFTTSLTDDIHAGIQLFSRDLGDIGNNDVKLDWAFLDYQWKEELGLRLGKMKVPHGLYNDTWDYDLLRTSILLPQGVYDEGFRETLVSSQGISIYGNISLGGGGRLGYNALAGTSGIGSDSGIAKIFSGNDMTFQSATIKYIAGGRMNWHTPLQGLMLGATIYQVDLTVNTESTSAPIAIEIDIPELQIFGSSVEYNIGDLTAAAEYYRMKIEPSTTMDMSRLGQPNPDPIEDSTETETYYGLISYRFTDWFEAGVYYSVYYPDMDDRDGDNQVAMGLPDYTAWQKDLTISTRFDMTDFWLVKLEVHFMDGVALCTVVDNPDGFEKDWMLFAVKTSFNF